MILILAAIGNLAFLDETVGQTRPPKILEKQLSFQGSIQTNLKFNYYPLVIREPDDYTLNVLMRSGYEGERWQIERELNLMATPPNYYGNPSVSGGEQTRVTSNP